MSLLFALIGTLAFAIVAPVLGCLLAGLDRKITARMQGRVGPVSYTHLKWRVALRICALGVAPSVMELGFAVSNMIMNNLLLSYGASDPLGSDGALAVMRVLSAVGMFTIMPSMGIAMGAQPIILSLIHI